VFWVFCTAFRYVAKPSVFLLCTTPIDNTDLCPWSLVTLCANHNRFVHCAPLNFALEPVNAQITAHDLNRVWLEFFSRLTGLEVHTYSGGSNSYTRLEA
jgi:hypothetical protein